MAADTFIHYIISLTPGLWSEWTELEFRARNELSKGKGKERGDPWLTWDLAFRRAAASISSPRLSLSGKEGTSEEGRAEGRTVRGQDQSTFFLTHGHMSQTTKPPSLSFMSTIFFFKFLVGLGIKPTSLCMLSKCSTAELCSQPLALCLVITFISCKQHEIKMCCLFLTGYQCCFFL